MYEFGREKCIQKFRIPVIKVKGFEPSTFESSQSRLEIQGSMRIPSSIQNKNKFVYKRTWPYHLLAKKGLNCGISVLSCDNNQRRKYSPKLATAQCTVEFFRQGTVEDFGKNLPLIFLPFAIRISSFLDF